MRLRTEEFGLVHGLPITTPERTAFDISRGGWLDDAIARVGALGNATGLRAEDVYAVARRRRGAADYASSTSR